MISKDIEGKKIKGSLEFLKTSPENIELFCQGFYERFALRNIQIKLILSVHKIFVRDKKELKQYLKAERKYDNV